ncbi:LamB/YcsF family protein [Alicyclobacillus sendaiensis]|uniref:5-oxoprolinase subunit A n=1 Tax=Alicyclobacillus sendaiensis PA2 TaxID=3029425 RepID=A0ABT6XW02_ALISE|nr:5-oxoprolinase subunit PxpA [Alicyclobacillus sendaiensis]MDI9258799.1 5-oxoprolinase subunit PxpA [Alicyclobacillus sendaiensis PA2]
MAGVDLNADLGEDFGAYRLANDGDILAYVTSANLACGMHAGDPVVMARSVALAKARGVAIGAHPGYPDLQGFGRRDMALDEDEIHAFVLYQLGALAAFARSQGVRLHHVKPHGALYNRAAVDRAAARAICRAIAEFDPSLKVYAPYGSELVAQAEAMGLCACCEGFADRRYEADGRLTPRRQADAVIRDLDEACEQVLTMVREGRVRARTGEWVEVAVDTVCLHGDGPHAVELAKALHKRLTEAGIHIRPA